MKVAILGLSISSSWGNGHATTYRSLVRALQQLGHEVVFLERDVPWYAENRDVRLPEGCRLELYGDLGELRTVYQEEIERADAVIVGSYVPDGVAVCEWVLENAKGATAFYDIDTPVTLAKLAACDNEYLTPALIPRFDLYLSFTGGPTLRKLERQLGARCARQLACGVDVDRHLPVESPLRWALGYLGTYSADRQRALDRLLLEPARRMPDEPFVVAGPSYPDSECWPENVERMEHLAPPEHPAFYGAQRFTLNVTRRDMIAAGWSPSVRLFEAAACGVPIISDVWPGIEQYFEPKREILLASSTEQVLEYLAEISEEERREIGRRARERVMRDHSSAHRAAELVQYFEEARRPR